MERFSSIFYVAYKFYQKTFRGRTEKIKNDFLKQVHVLYQNKKKS